HWFLLRPGSDLHGLTALVDVVTHIIVPILMVVVWLVAGPRGLTDRLVVVGSFAFPVLYAGWIFLYGALTDWYPYHFIDVAMIGYGPALTMAAVIFVAFAAPSLLAWRGDVALPRAERLGPGARGRRGLATHARPRDRRDARSRAMRVPAAQPGAPRAVLDQLPVAVGAQGGARRLGPASLRRADGDHQVLRGPRAHSADPPLVLPVQLGQGLLGGGRVLPGEVVG